ncbi:hypothetical protein Z517_09284 [Fonsecaea pedrosoi CBS 271.37]|uniref:Uncharacterized protein n=1 Tax=Fonsecaea pedrosoi CBS 271.37 TaxID=1442368 RepID=A0A0D2GDU4_9EURO|nr:uncharacterized protein Z517_09284 [Fonsecaea pedrosoi CBS 271.37]KIW76840.1 hypothetical protein Z517_09284 [Fonsecaea pedrosoi CBS 271.37]
MPAVTEEDIRPAAPLMRRHDGSIMRAIVDEQVMADRRSGVAQSRNSPSSTGIFQSPNAVEEYATENVVEAISTSIIEDEGIQMDMVEMMTSPIVAYMRATGSDGSTSAKLHEVDHRDDGPAHRRDHDRARQDDEEGDRNPGGDRFLFRQQLTTMIMSVNMCTTVETPNRHDRADGLVHGHNQIVDYMMIVLGNGRGPPTLNVLWPTGRDEVLGRAAEDETGHAPVGDRVFGSYA